MELQTFLRENPVFTYDTFVRELNPAGTKSPHTLNNMLAQHLHRGHIIRIRRKLFASIPYGADASNYPINPYLITGYLTDDAVVAYHTALAFYGVAYSVTYRMIYLTAHRSQTVTFRDETYVPTMFPRTLCDRRKQNIYVNTEDVQGLDVRITSMERTLVDVLDRPLLGGGWEETWRSLDMIERLKIDKVVDYALLLGKVTTIAKVGFYLETRQSDLDVTKEHLKQLQNHRPASPHYLDNSARSKSQYNAQWNLMIPKTLIEKSWEEKLEWETEA